MRHRETIAATIAGGWSDEIGMAILFLVVAIALAWSRLDRRAADYRRLARRIALALATTVVLAALSVLAWKYGWLFGVWAIAFSLVPVAGMIRAAANLRLRRRLRTTHDQGHSNRPIADRRRSPTESSTQSPPLLIEEITLASLAPTYRAPIYNALRTSARELAAIFAVPSPSAVRTLFLWVFADRASDQMLATAQHVGPVYLLRGGGILADQSLAVLFGDADEHIEESEHEVLARLGSFEKVRTRMIFARHAMLCSNRVWTFALDQLIERTTCVVMDLRRYEHGRTGCEYEIGVLIDRVPLGSVAFVVESVANRDEVRALIERCWADMATDSPNRLTGNAVRLVLAQHIDDDIPKKRAPAYLPVERERIGLEQLLVDLAAKRPAANFAPPDPSGIRRG